MEQMEQTECSETSAYKITKKKAYNIHLFSHVLEEALGLLVLFSEQYRCLYMVSRLGCLTC